MLNDTFTSTGAKFFAHQQVMYDLRAGKGHPVVTHVMLTDVCQHTCAFCSVQARAGDSLTFEQVKGYLKTLLRYGLKAVILSGGGNPILYKCKETGADFNDVVDWIADMRLEIGLITNGMPLKVYHDVHRESWKTVRPQTLDRLTWIRVSMAGLDHSEERVDVPDLNPTLTTLGFSYVAHDLYTEPGDTHHGKVSRPADLKSGDMNRAPDRPFEARIPDLTNEFLGYCRTFQPKYLRLLPNCLEPELIEARCRTLDGMAAYINHRLEREVVFVQYKPPHPPKACYLGFVHPVLAPSGYVMPCDSHCLNENANHKLGGEPWRICRWDEVAQLYENPVHSLIANPAVTCPGCVFGDSNTLLGTVVDGTADLTPPTVTPEHVNFV